MEIMTIQDVKHLKAKTEQGILNLISDFHSKTGLYVTGIDYDFQIIEELRFSKTIETNVKLEVNI